MTLRPKLSRDVGARRHVVGGRRLVVLHHVGDGRSLELGEREWALVSCMDGTRDVGGLVQAAARRGARLTEETAARFVEELAAAHLLEVDQAPRAADAEDAPAEREAERGAGGADDAAPTPPERPLSPLPGFRLVCDGAGSCCRLYPTVAFLPLDVARARAARPDVLGGGDDEWSLFTPVRGAVDAVSAVASIDGRCALLEPDGRCGIHASLGAAHKPVGCRTFPTSFVDDGVEVRVAPRPECLCVLRSGLAAGDEGEPLAAPGATRRDVPRGASVRVLPRMVALGGGHRAPREELGPWSRTLATAAARTPDGARALDALASSLEERGLDGARQAALIASPPPLRAETLLPIAQRIGAAAGARGRESWRAPGDLAHQTFLALETACDLLQAAPEAFEGGPGTEQARRIEAFHLTTTLFGHLSITEDGDPDLAASLRQRAAVLLVARALGAVVELSGLRDPAFGWPLALSEAVVRAFALASRPA